MPRNIRDLRAVTAALSALGGGLAWLGVGLLGSEPDHAVGGGLVAGGTAVIGGAVVAGVLGWVQKGIDDARSDREAARAEAANVDLVLATTTQLRGFDLSERRLVGRYLADRDLSHAVLGGTDLTDAVLRGARLVDADLTGAVLVGADLTGADLTGADLTGADLAGAALPPGVRATTSHDATTTWPAGYS